MAFPFSESTGAESQPVMSVSDLTEQIKDLLEGALPAVWVAGEISNFSRPQSGHCYFTLKDERAQIRGVMWRTAASRLRFELEDGLEVICHGDLEVYAPARHVSARRAADRTAGRRGFGTGLAQACASGWRPKVCLPSNANDRCRASRARSPWSPVRPAPPCVISWKSCGVAGAASTC